MPRSPAPLSLANAVSWPVFLSLALAIGAHSSALVPTDTNSGQTKDSHTNSDQANSGDTPSSSTAVSSEPGADKWRFWRPDLVSLEQTLQARYPFLWDNSTHTMIPLREYYDNALTIESPQDFIANNSAQSMQYNYEKSIEFTSRFTRDYSIYTDPTELQLSGGPKQNARQCVDQLRWLHRQLQQSRVNGSKPIETINGVDSINLVRYLDSFGRPEAASYVGNNHWYGSYDECLALKFNKQQANQQMFSNRYCLGKLTSRYWPDNDNFVPRPSIKIGLCIPQSCDTKSVIDKQLLTTVNITNGDNNGTSEQQQLTVLQLINDIMLMNFSPQSRDTYKLVDIYCLPDDDSPIRSLSSSAYVLIGLCLVWCALVLSASLLYLHRQRKRLNRQQGPLVDYIMISKQSQIVIGDNNNKAHDQSCATMPLVSLDQATLKQRSVCLSDDNNSSSSSGGDNNRETTILDTILNVLALSTSVNHLKSVPHLNSQTRVNLIPLSFLKVLCTLAIVGGHTAHWNAMSSKASKIVLDYLTLHWVQITLVFAYAVDTFYVMAGVLFGYFTMKKLQDKQMPASALLKFKSWLGINGLVWFRLSTIYIPVYWFSYSLAVHLGSGPMWDYGTNENSFRGTCIKQTRWYHFILYFASLGRDHTEPPCNEPAWFIETYIRIFLVLPPITYLLIKYPKWSIAAVASVTALTAFITGFLTYNQTAVSSSYALKYAISAAAIEAKYSGFSYLNTFTYRLAPVLMGTLAGIYLHKYDEGTIKQWPRWMRGPISLKLIILGHLLIAFETLTAKYVVDNLANQSESSLLWNNVLSTAKLQPIWCFLNALLIIRLTTYFQTSCNDTSDCVSMATCTDRTGCFSLLAIQLLKFMRHRYWIILSRLTFCIYLIHCEIIYFIVAHNYQFRANVDVFKTVRDFLFTIMFSYLVATIVYLMYEAPMDKLVKTIVGTLPNNNSLSKVDSHHHHHPHKQQPTPMPD